MTVEDLIRQELERGEYDGLVNIEAECGCEKSDLWPCDSGPERECRFGWKHHHPGGYGWAIWTQKDAPSKEQWDTLEDFL